MQKVVNGACVVASVAVLGLLSVITAEASSPQYTAEVVDRINMYRAEAGVRSVVEDAAVSRAAQAHAEYQSTNSVLTHVQDPAKPGFTGVAFTDRLGAAGYRGAGTGEIIDQGDRGTQAVDLLMAAIFHRFVILDPVPINVGVGDAGQVTVIVFALPEGAAAPVGTSVFYPSDGQREVPTSFNSDFEEPDPVPEKGVVGYPASIQFTRDQAASVTSFAMTTGGQAVPARVVGENGRFGLVPLDVLREGTNYAVTFTGTAGGQAFSDSWSFATVGTPPAQAALSTASSPAPSAPAPSASGGGSGGGGGGGGGGCVASRDVGLDPVLMGLLALAVSCLAVRTARNAGAVVRKGRWSDPGPGGQ